MEENKEIVVHEVNFHGDMVDVIEQDRRLFVAMKPLCLRMGLDWDDQNKLIKRDPVLNATKVMMTVVAADGKNREMVTLPLEYLNGWLFKLDVSRYDGPLREKLIQYQKECYAVLHHHFFRQQSELVVLQEQMMALNQTASRALALAQEARDMVVKAQSDSSRSWLSQDERIRRQNNLIEDLRIELMRLSDEIFIPLPVKVFDYQDLKIYLMLVDHQPMLRAEDFLRLIGAHKYTVAQKLTTLGFERDKDYVIKTADEMGNLYGAKPGYVFSRMGLSKVTKYISLITPAGMRKVYALAPDFHQWYIENVVPSFGELYSIPLKAQREESTHDQP